jgi:uncharacterized small protein (DUF1192 family)
MPSRKTVNIRHIIKMHASMANAWIASELGVTPASVRRQLERVAEYPARIGALEAEIAELRALHDLYMEARQERKKHTMHGRAPNGQFYKGLRIIRKKEREEDGRERRRGPTETGDVRTPRSLLG